MAWKKVIIILAFFSSALSLPLDDEDYLEEPNEITGKKVEEWTEDSGVNPEEMGEYLEGDIIATGTKNLKNGMLDANLKWKDGIVPYEIGSYFTRSDLDTIEKAINQYHKRTCIRFRKKTDDDDDYLSIKGSNTGCWSSVGRQGGKQELNLQSGNCLKKVGTAEHELMHALGFTHEQNRYERDEYVAIKWDNIMDGREHNFKKVDKGVSSGYGVDYDYGSVMHYSKKAFSTNNQDTIVPKDKGVTIGQRDGFSQGDIDKINAMYNCTNVPDETVTEHKVEASTSSGILASLISGIL